MFKRFSLNYALLSMAVDAALTVAALAASHIFRATWVAWVWPADWHSLIGQAQAIPMALWPVVLLLWQAVFALTSVYDPRRNYRAVDEFQTAAFAEALACLALAGLLYLSERAVARWLFVLYVVRGMKCIPQRPAHPGLAHRRSHRLQAAQGARHPPARAHRRRRRQFIVAAALSRAIREHNAASQRRRPCLAAAGGLQWRPMVLSG